MDHVVSSTQTVCMVDEACTKGYPKQFSDATLVMLHSKMLMDTPAIEGVMMGKQSPLVQKEVDNRWIVSYNP